MSGPRPNKSFCDLKDALTKAEMLGYFDPNAKTKVITDASPVGLGGILVQIQAGQPRIIAYASRSLSDVEKRYSQTEKEALGIVWACERFHIYLYGISFELLTDHKPLQYIYAKKAKPSARIERWVLRLQSYDFQVVYIPGPRNIADCLSRLISKTGAKSSGQNIGEEHIRFIASHATPVAIPIQQVEKESSVDPEMSLLRKCVINENWTDIPEAYTVMASGKRGS